MYKVIISQLAQGDLQKIFLYITEELGTERVARKILYKIGNKVKSLEMWPERFMIYDRRNGRRLMHVGKYKVLYTVDRDKREVMVLRVFHALQNIDLEEE